MWIGQSYTFSVPIVALIVLNNYLLGLRIPIITVKTAAGIYVEDIWVSFGFAAINLISSVILVRYLGVFGVILGSIIGSALTADWYRPIVIFKKVFYTSPRYYFKLYFKYLILGCLYMILTYALCNIITINNILLNFILRCFICLIVPNLITFILFRNTDEFKFIQDTCINFIIKKSNIRLKRII